MSKTANEHLFASAYGVASSLLLMEKPITVDALDRTISAVGAMPHFKELDLERLRKQLEANNNIRVGGYSVIDDRDYQAWIRAAREERPFEFWKRYRHWLLNKRQMPELVV